MTAFDLSFSTQPKPSKTMHFYVSYLFCFSGNIEPLAFSCKQCYYHHPHYHQLRILIMILIDEKRNDIEENRVDEQSELEMTVIK